MWYNFLLGLDSIVMMQAHYIRSSITFINLPIFIKTIDESYEYQK